MKIDLSDTTFIIPIRLDSIIRLENLFLTINHILEKFQTFIVVLEAAPYNNGIIKAILKENITYKFIEDKDPVFHRTKYLNKMTLEVKTDFIGIWDADIIIEHEQIIDSIKNLRQKTCDIAFPYDGTFLDISYILRNHYFVYRDINFLKANQLKMYSTYSIENIIGALGGGFFVKRDKYIFAGMENEAFYGWGLEDGERYYRWLNFDYKIYRSKGCLYHLTHPRDMNGMFRSKYQQNKAHHEINDIVNYTRDELANKILKNNKITKNNNSDQKF